LAENIDKTVEAGKNDGSPLERPDNIFDVKGVFYHYLETEALTDINLEVASGESVALLGANGSGKSTLLKMLDGLVFPSSGAISAFGAALSEEALADEGFNRAFRSRVGFVFQNSDAQLFSPTVWEEVAFGPVYLGMAPHEVSQRVAETLHILGLEGLEERPPYHLSGGEKKKVALATVLAIRPEVFLLDEPTAGLDPKTSTFLARMIIQLIAEGKTVITATQDLSLAAAVAGRAIVLGEDHTVAGEGEAASVLADRELLLAANLIHDHPHRHDGFEHYHPHSHVHERDHHAEGHTSKPDSP
jgi:cobalt/nickel transport system ATP-binding protein